MTPAVHRILLDVLSSIEPSAAQKRQAKGSHRYLRRELQKTAVADKIDRILLIGSYARRTAIAPIDDIDLLVILHRDAWPSRWLSAEPEPAKVLADLHGVIKRAYRRTTVRKQRRSIGIRKSRQPIDVVPAIASETDGVFLIPDREEGDWIRTAPTRYAEHVQWLNAQTSKRFVPTVKLLKWWNSTLPASTRLKSFAIETLAGHLFARRVPHSLDDALLLFFDFTTHVSGVLGPDPALAWRSNYGVSLGLPWPSATDLAGLGNNVLEGVGSPQALRFAGKARVARDRLSRIEERPSDANIRRQLSDLFKLAL